MSGEINCICVKWGNKYSSQEVNRLFNSIKKKSTKQCRFFCMTDDHKGLDKSIEILSLPDSPLDAKLSEAQPQLKRSKGALRKIGVFKPDLIPDLDGPLLCLDIDIIVTDIIDSIFDYDIENVCMPPPFKAKSHIETKGEGSVIRFDPKIHTFLYEDMARKPKEMIAFSMGSEQRYTSFTAQRHNALVSYPSNWVVSFLKHCRPRRPLNLLIPPKLPNGAKIVCFPSDPKADVAVEGYRRGLKSTRPAPWIAQYMSD